MKISENSPTSRFFKGHRPHARGFPVTCCDHAVNFVTVRQHGAGLSFLSLERVASSAAAEIAYRVSRRVDRPSTIQPRHPLAASGFLQRPRYSTAIPVTQQSSNQSRVKQMTAADDTPLRPLRSARSQFLARSIFQFARDTRARVILRSMHRERVT